jgi:murein L,D-transpeptidase YcbB/YkuD
MLTAAPRALLATVFFIATLFCAANALAQTNSDPERLRARLEALRTAEAAARPNARERKVIDAAALLYEARGYAPIWDRPGRREALLVELAGTAADGLDPNDYALERLRKAWSAPSSDEAAPYGAELLATQTLLRALGDLYRGMADPARLDGDWNFAPRPLDMGEAIRTVADAVESGAIAPLFDRARPPQAPYRDLRAGLARLRALEAQGGWPTLPPGPTLKPGVSDARVPILRQRLAAGGYLASADGGEVYDAALVEAVRRFQDEQFIKADGAVGEGTRAALALPVSKRIEQVRVNLERARWLLHEAEGDFVLVDIAGYKVTLYRGGKVTWSARVQVGTPFRKTPVFKSEINRVTLNPTWTIPPGIMRKDTLPKIRKDPGYLAKNRMRVIDASGQEVSPSSVDWSNPRGIVVRQDAGEGNSLGRVVIRFPNEHAVYLHDTPHTEHFADAQRIFSSGCIRVENPRELAALVLDDPAWDRAAIDRAIDAGKTLEVQVKRPLTLLLGYWTVQLHEGGRIAYKTDVYGFDAGVLAALNAPVRYAGD